MFMILEGMLVTMVEVFMHMDIMDIHTLPEVTIEAMEVSLYE